MSTPTQRPDDPMAEGTILTDVLGNHAKVKLIVAFLGESDQDRNATELARLAGIDRSTFYEHIDDLLAYDVVEETRQVANSQMYRINRDSDAAEDLARLEWHLIEAFPGPDALSETESAPESDSSTPEA